MTHPMRDFGRILRDARAAFVPVDVYPTDTDRRLAAMPPRGKPERLVQHWHAIAFIIAIFAAGLFLGWFANKAIANAAAAVVQAEAGE